MPGWLKNTLIVVGAVLGSLLALILLVGGLCVGLIFFLSTAAG